MILRNSHKKENFMFKNWTVWPEFVLKYVYSSNMQSKLYQNDWYLKNLKMSIDYVIIVMIHFLVFLENDSNTDVALPVL